MKDKHRRRLDIGKIGALKKAGWTVKAIAEEMGCTESAVYNVLKKLGIHIEKKMGKEKIDEKRNNEEAAD